MGIRLRCANCHDHPLDHWTQDDYHGLAAIFARVKQARFVSLNPQGENINARTGVPAMPRVPGEFFIDNEPSDHRLPFVSWLLDDTNPYFARAMVNRIWESLMGRGLVEPVDDLRSTNPATHPALLKRLADDFVKHDFDIRKTIAQICTSQAYQRSRGRIDAPEFHRRFYANASVRALSPEVLADAICDITGIREDYPGQPPGTRAVQLFDSRIPSKSLDVLGRCSRTESCESPSNNLMDGLSTQLHLLNGDLINAKIANDHSILNELVRANKTTNEIVKFFYTSAFGRQPSQQELDYWISKIEQEAADDFENARIQRLEDFVWSILNSKEFTTNH